MGCRLVGSPSKLSLSARRQGVSRGLLWGVVRKQNTVSTLTSLAPTLPASEDQWRLKETLRSAPGPQEDISVCFLHEQEISSTPGSVIRSMLSVTSGGPGSMIFTVGLCKRGPTCSSSVYPCLSPETSEPSTWPRRDGMLLIHDV